MGCPPGCWPPLAGTMAQGYAQRGRAGSAGSATGVSAPTACQPPPGSTRCWVQAEPPVRKVGWGPRRASLATCWPASAGRLLHEDQGAVANWSHGLSRQKEAKQPEGPAGPSEGPHCCQSCLPCGRGTTERPGKGVAVVCGRLPERVTGEDLALRAPPRTRGKVRALRPGRRLPCQHECRGGLGSGQR